MRWPQGICNDCGRTVTDRFYKTALTFYVIGIAQGIFLGWLFS